MYQLGSTKAEIKYKFHAKLISQRNEKLKGRTFINVRQQAFNYNMNVNIEKSAKLSSWCCKNKGYCKIHVSYPQDTYNPSQVADISAVVDNSNSLLSVTGISYRFFYSLRLKCSGKETHFSSRTLLSGDIPKRIPAGESLLNQSGIEIKLNLPSKINELANMYSTKGQLIDCMYTNEVSATMDGSCMCCGDNPSVQSIMTIVPNVIMPPSAPEAPSDWNPVMLEPVSLHYDSRYEVVPSAPMAS